MPPNKAIVGENAFAHEAGIHVHGVLQKAETYEPIKPEMVGHTRRIVMGKHTGARAIRSKLDEYDIENVLYQNIYLDITADDIIETLNDDKIADFFNER